MTPGASFEAAVIGGSAGALEALAEILPVVPARCAASIAVVVHLPPTKPSLLVDVLGARCALPVREVDDKEPLLPGTVHVAPPNYHLMIERSRTFALSVDDPVHFSRPSIDVLFESAADAYGAGLVAVLLAGANQDGAAGLARVCAAGGAIVIQDPRTALAPEMPNAAIASGCGGLILEPLDIGRFLAARLRCLPPEFS